MIIFFQVLQGFFYFFTLVIWALLLRGEIMFGSEIFKVIKEVLMPGYLIFCGIMIGYIIAAIWKNKSSGNTVPSQERIFKKSFIIGILMGLVLALSYTLF